MENLVKALTRAANAVADYYERQAQPLLSVSTAAALGVVGVAEVAPEPKKERKVRVSAKVAEVGGFDVPQPQPEMTEKQSLDEMYKLATSFVNLDDVAPQKLARQTEARTYMAQAFKAGTMKDLLHDQRTEFISWLRARVTEKNGVHA